MTLSLLYPLFGVFIGVLLGYILKLNIKFNFKLINSFSGSFLLSILFLDIFPELDFHKNSKIGLIVLAGVLIQLLIENFTKGIEHSHYHKPQKKSFGLFIFTGLFIHALIEGFPLLLHHELALGIGVHKIGVGMILFFLFNEMNLTKWKIFLFLSLFSLVTPLGTFISQWVSDYMIEYLFLPLSVGVLLHISSTLIFESTSNHSLKLRNILSILLGFLFAYFS